MLEFRKAVGFLSATYNSSLLTYNWVKSGLNKGFLVIIQFALGTFLYISLENIKKGIDEIDLIL